MLVMHFAWYEVVVLALIEFWPYTLLVTLICLILGVFTRGKLRFAFFTVPALLLAVALTVGAVILSYKLKENVSSATYRATAARRHEVLAQPRTINQVAYPAGTILDFADDAKTTIDTAELPGPTRVYGILLTGKLKPSTDYRQEVTLAEDTVIDGWPCKAGQINLRKSGNLESCDLSRAQSISRLPPHAGEPLIIVPAGSQLSMSSGSDSGAEFQLPDDHPVRLADVGATLPGGAMLHLYLNNAVRSVYPTEEHPMVVDGLSFTTETSWIYSPAVDEDSFGPATPALGVSGELLQNVRCDGQLYTPSTHPYVRVYTRPAALMFTYVTDDKAVRTPQLPLSHCKIQPVPADPS